MAGIRLSVLKSICNPVNSSFWVQSSRSYAKLARYAGQSPGGSASGYFNYNRKELYPCFRPSNAQFTVLESCTDSKSYKSMPVAEIWSLSSSLRFRSYEPFLLTGPLSKHSSKASFSTKVDEPGNMEGANATGTSEPSISDSGVDPSQWLGKIKGVWQSSVDAVMYTGQKAKEASDELTPHVEQLLDTHPYLKTVVIPVGYTLTGTILAWLVMPRLLRKLHKYMMQGPVALLPEGLRIEQVPYERSFWGALEDPVRYLVTFMAFSQIAAMVAPTAVASQYISEAWRGAVILSFVWFLHRWKTNMLAYALGSQSLDGLQREKLLTLDRISAVGLFVIGLMALAEACGVAVQSILTVGGIGGVATAFAARDILGNVLSGLVMQFSHPFSLGDTIKAGSIEGQVVEMGLTTTSLLNAEKFPVLVPNSLFSSQVIVNKSRAQWRAMISKLPLEIEDLEKIPHISDEIKGMLRTNTRVFMGKEAPYCYLSRVEKSCAELTLGCNLKHMSKDELYSTQQEILLQSVQIIKKHGARLGTTLETPSA